MLSACGGTHHLSSPLAVVRVPMIGSTLLLHSSPPCFKFNPFLSSPPPPHLNSRSFSIGPKPIPNPSEFNFRNTQRCRAVFTEDAPFAAAIGACMLSSLLFPVSVPSTEEEEEGINSTDARLAVMGIVSFIPYFNWLSWVFAWLDTGKRRYALYSLVYLAPYLRSNLSLSPEESWLPIASILFCIVHIQLEASIRNGDIQGFQLFRDISHQQSSSTKKKGHSNQHQEMSEEGIKKGKKNLPPAEEQSRDIGGWEDSQRPLQHRQRFDEDLGDDGEQRSKH